MKKIKNIIYKKIKIKNYKKKQKNLLKNVTVLNQKYKIYKNNYNYLKIKIKHLIQIVQNIKTN